MTRHAASLRSCVLCFRDALNAESIAPLESDAFVSEDVSRRVTPTGFKPVTF